MIQNSGASSFNSAKITSVPLLDVQRGNQPLKEEVLEAISQIFDSGRFVGGPFCHSLEQAVADACETQFAVGCASGSDALLLALMAIGVGDGDEVIVPSFTFFATASAISRLGATPVFVDIDPSTFNIDTRHLEELINRRTKAILPVHLFGQCCDMQPILEVASEHGLHVIEDCAQSIGASYQGRPAGSLGLIGCFSFYPTKNLGGFGDSGMLTTSDPEIADRLRLLANHGMRARYYHQEIGINSRLDAIQAAVLNIKIKQLARYSAQRTQNAKRYHQLMQESGLTGNMILPTTSKNCVHVWNQYTIRIPNGRRDQVRQQLTDMRVGTEIYYPIPLHQQACYATLGYKPGSLPQTEMAASEVLSLPIFPELMLSEQRYIVDCLAQIMQASTTYYRLAS